MSVTGQYSGNGLGYFNTVIYAKIGVTSVVMQLAFNLVYAVVSAIGALFGACLSDRMPRRLPLVFGTLGERIFIQRRQITNKK
jgi:MFS family permease